MLVLGVETSCDETSVAVVEDGRRILSNCVASQIKVHRAYGGVVPELASRMHTENIHWVCDKAMADSGKSLSDIDVIAVTHGPGLEGALVVGTTFAKTLAALLDVPLVGVNHLHGHLYAIFLTDEAPAFPFISLIISGGHTSLVLVKDHFQFQLLGMTQDDAAGEAFDKVARCLGLGYPGGPEIEKKAKEGNPKAFRFPRALKKGPHFSFSGLKTAVFLEVKKWGESPLPVADFAASFQAAVIDSLTQKALAACEKYGVDTLVLTGGVSANRTLANECKEAGQAKGVRVLVAPIDLCTDNAAMIASSGYFYVNTMKKRKKIPSFNVQSQLSLCN